MYYKVVKPLNRSGFVDSKGLRCDGVGFIGKVVMKFDPMKYLTLKQRDGLQIDARTDIVEEVAEFDYETAVQFKLFEEVDNDI